MTATKFLPKIKLPNFTFHSVYKACTFPHIEFIRFGPHRLEHRSSAAPELASAYPPGGATIYGNYVLQMSATNLLSKINLQNRFGPLRPKPVRSAAPELASAYPPGCIAIYEHQVLQLTERNFLTRIKLSFKNDSNYIVV